MTLSVLITLVLSAFSVGDGPIPLGPFGGSMRSVSPDPDDAEVLLLVSAGDGLLRSTDGGDGWQPFGVGLPKTVTVLQRSPGDGDRMYAVVGNTLFASFDRGATWAPRVAGLLGVVHVAASPEPDVLLLVTSSGAVTRSVDAGSSVAQVAAVTGVVDGAFAPSDGQRAYLAGDQGVWRSDDGGASFAPTGLTDRCEAVAVDPADRSRLIALVTAGPTSLCRSEDGGATWHTVHSWSPNPATEPFKARLAWSDGRAWACIKDHTIVDLLLSATGGASFVDQSGFGGGGDLFDLEPMPGGKVAVAFGPLGHVAEGALVVGGQLNAFDGLGVPSGSVEQVLAVPGSDVVAVLSTGFQLDVWTPEDGLQPAVYPAYVLGAGRDGRWFAALSGESTHATPQSILTFQDDQLIAHHQTLIYALQAFVVSPDGQTVLALSGSFSASDPKAWRSTDAGMTWEPVLGLDATVAYMGGRFHPLDPDRVVVAGQGFVTYLSVDGGASFSPGGGSGISLIPPAQRDPFDNQHIIVPAGSGFQQTFDGGATWHDPAPATAYPASQAIFDPLGRDVGVLIAGGEVLLSEDGFATYTTWLGGDAFLEGASITQASLDPDDGSLVVATSLDGAWRLPGVSPYANLAGESEGSGSVLPRHFAVGVPEIGASWTLAVDQVVGAGAVFFVVGLEQVSTPAFGGTVVVGGDPIIVVTALADGPFGEPGKGEATLAVSVPNHATLAGMSLFSQAVVFDPGASGPWLHAMSNGLRSTFR